MLSEIIIPCATRRAREAIAFLSPLENDTQFSWHLLTADFHLAQNRWNTCVGNEVYRTRQLAAAIAARSRPETVISLIATNDFGAVVASIVAEDYLKARNQTFSLGLFPTMRCRHKYYQRKASVPHMLVGPGLWLENDSSFYPEIGYPFYAKLPLSSFGVGGQLIETEEEFVVYRKRAFSLGRDMVQQLHNLPGSVLAEFPLISQNGFIMEVPIMMNQVTVMGRCVHNEVFCDTTVETLFHPGTRNVRCFRWPALLSNPVREAIEAIVQPAVGKLGFCHGLWNAEVWWSETAEGPFVEIVEINPRPATYFWQLLFIGAGYSIYQDAAEMATGGSGFPPKEQRESEFLEQSTISTTGNGRAGDLIDYAMLRRLEKDDVMVIYHFAPDDLIQQLSPYPVIVAEIVTWTRFRGSRDSRSFPRIREFRDL